MFSCLCVSVMDLEEKLHHSEMDRRNSLQRAQLLEGQLQEVRGELAGTLDHLQELKDLLQRTQLTSDQQQAAIDKLAAELRWADPPPCSDCWEATAVHPSLDIQNVWGFEHPYSCLAEDNLNWALCVVVYLPLKEIMMDLERPQNTFCF